MYMYSIHVLQNITTMRIRIFYESLRIRIFTFFEKELFEIYKDFGSLNLYESTL